MRSRFVLETIELEPRTVPTCLGTIVPAYFYPVPGGYWDQMTQQASRVPMIAIMNPNSGPGSDFDAAYFEAVSRFREAGGHAIGYVSTNYGNRPLEAVQQDIALYAAWYPIDGIFLDELPSTAERVDHYQTLYNYVHEVMEYWFIVANPGTNTAEEYLARPASDFLITFESRTGYLNYRPSPWMESYGSWQFGHLPYNVPTVALMEQYVDLAMARNAGWIYVTDDDTVPDLNPWDTLPSYWSRFIDKLASCASPGSAPAGSLLQPDAAVLAALLFSPQPGAAPATHGR